MNKAPKRFVGIHAHDVFSTYDGLGYPGEHFDYVLESGGEGLAITNHGHANSYAHAYLNAKKITDSGRKFKFLPGCEFYVHPDLVQWRNDMVCAREKREQEKRTSKKTSSIDEGADTGLTVENEDETRSTKHYSPLNRRHHLVVLAKNSTGLEKLFGLISRGYKEGFYKFPRIDYAMLAQAAHGDLIVSSACIGGPLSFEIFEEFKDVAFDQLTYDLVDDVSMMEKIQKKIGNVVDRLIDSVGRENFFLELQFNKLPSQHLTNRCLIEYSKRTNIPLVVTADSHYCRPELWKEREIYKKLGWLNYQEYDPRTLPQSIDELKAELYPKNADQMWASFLETTSGMGFYDHDIVCNAIERTHDIAFDLIGDVSPDRSMKMPSYVIPKGKSAKEALTDAVNEGMRKKGFDKDPKYVARLEKELSVIDDKDFNEYFLTMKAIIDIAKSSMLVGIGRGSGAGALVNYVLGITDVDPLEYDLLFERFISRSRKEYPDIDTDFANRDLLIELMRKEFGTDNVVPISNYNTFKLKSLVKDVSRFWGIPFEETNEATRTVDEEVRHKVLGPGDDKNLFELKFDDAMKHSPKFREYIEKYPHVAENLKVLLHQNKALGRHASGVIVSEKIADRMPLILSRGELQTPWVEGMHFKQLEEFGWIKYDLLGLETLRIVERCISLILAKRYGKKFEISLENGETVILFENESVLLKNGKYKTVKDLDENDNISYPIVKTKPKNVMSDMQ